MKIKVIVHRHDPLGISVILMYGLIYRRSENCCRYTFRAKFKSYWTEEAVRTKTP